MSREKTNRFYDADERRKRCEQKDQVIKPILEGLRIRHPNHYRALVMPCKHAPELEILEGAGVPRKNIVAIERDGKIWRYLRDEAGLDVGHAPMDANTRMDYVQAEHPEGFDLMYLDFYGQVTPNEHYHMIDKIMGLRMLKPGARLILNFARGRSTSEAAELNKMLTKKSGLDVPTQTILDCARRRFRHPKPTLMKDHSYKSVVGKNELLFVTTETAW